MNSPTIRGFTAEFDLLLTDVQEATFNNPLKLGEQEETKKLTRNGFQALHKMFDTGGFLTIRVVGRQLTCELVDFDERVKGILSSFAVTGNNKS